MTFVPAVGHTVVPVAYPLSDPLGVMGHAVFASEVTANQLWYLLAAIVFVAGQWEMHYFNSEFCG